MFIHIFKDANSCYNSFFESIHVFSQDSNDIQWMRENEQILQ